MKNFSFTSYLIPLMILFVLLKPNLIFSQGEANWWYFGQKAGLNFPFSAPTTVTNGVLWTYEGGASIADASGNLLFYTSGDTVYNKLHLIMANGTGLLGDKSSTQATMIIKRPGSSNIYYIFTNRAGGFPRELRYSIVDMNLAAGNGSVTVKNVLLHNSTSEKLNATLACNKKDVWIISHDLNGNGFRTFLLSASGISAPVLSAVGYSIPGSGWTNQAVGQLKVSPDGRKIAIGYFSARAEIYDFNRFTGVVSNPLTIVASPNFGYYGCEFSPDSKVLYYNGPWSNQITQIDLCAGSNAAILSSSVSLIASTGNQTGGFQLGPDGKIYIALNCFFAPKFLAVINNPNTLGLGCNFVNNAINLSGRNAGLSIPNFPSFYVTPTLTVTIPSFTSITSCATATFVSPVLSTCSNTNIITSYSWNFGDPGSGPLNTSSLANPVHNYATPGTYSVNLIVYSPCPDTLKQVITISSATVNATVQNANCISPTGSVIINSVTNGVPNYTLAEASTTLAVGFNTPYTLSNVSVGTHTYVLTSANGCNTTFTAQILPGGSQPNITATGPVTLNCVPNTT
ncbi:MAG: PKD domain-containing protein, partial [Bacteroidota bacterium]